MRYDDFVHDTQPDRRLPARLRRSGRNCRNKGSVRSEEELHRGATNTSEK